MKLLKRIAIAIIAPLLALCVMGSGGAGGAGSSNLTPGTTVVGAATPGATLYVDSNGLLQQAAGDLPSGATYNPANFFPSAATQKFWLNFTDTSKLVKAGGGTPANGDLVSDAKNSDGSILFSNATGGTQPSYVTGIANGFGALRFNNKMLASSDLTFLNNQKIATLLVVERVDAGSSQWVYEDSWTAATAPRMWLEATAGGGFTGVVRKASGESSQITATVGNFASGSGHVHAVIFEWFPTIQRYQLWVDGRDTVYNDRPASNGTITNSNAARIQIGDTATSSADQYILEISLFTGAWMNERQRQQWFAAVKSRYALVDY